MPYEIHNTNEGLILELRGGVTVRHAAELGKCLASSLASGGTVIVRAQEVEDVDTSILQMLISLRKTTAAFIVENPSEAFENAVHRCALRHELSASKDTP
jgi:anti-anti-sigma regulatory factor